MVESEENTHNHLLDEARLRRIAKNVRACIPPIAGSDASIEDQLKYENPVQNYNGLSDSSKSTEKRV